MSLSGIVRNEAGRLLWLALKLSWRCSVWLALSMVFLLIVQACVLPINLLVFRQVVNGETPFALWLGLAVGLVIVEQLLALTGQGLRSVLGDRLTMFVVEQIMIAAKQWQGLRYFEDPVFADDLERVRTHVSQAGLTIMQHGVTVATTSVTIVGLLILLGSVHPLIPVLCIVCALPSLFLWWTYVTNVAKAMYWQTPDARRLEYYRNATLDHIVAQDVRLYALGSFFQKRYDVLFEHTLEKVNAERVRLAWVLTGATTLVAGAGGAAFVYVVWLAMQGQLSVGDVVMYSGAVGLLLVQLRLVGITGGEMIELLGFLPSVLKVLDTEPDLPEIAEARTVARPMREGIVFEKVSFQYPGQSRAVLQNVSFTLRAGESMALVGLNGAGKTTIVKLLLRFYDPTAGRILLDGIDIREYELEDLRRAFAAIFQDFVRYDLTLRENIGVGDIAALDESERLQVAAGKANMSELVDELSDGWETMLGKAFGGRELSGGQWQKIALARAFLRDSQVLILDEPTASLDVQTEYELYKQFYELTQGRTTLLISHRFSTVRMAQHILYLKDGRIEEEGTHQELLARKGGYAHLYNVQAAHYSEGIKA